MWETVLAILEKGGKVSTHVIYAPMILLGLFKFVNSFPDWFSKAVKAYDDYINLRDKLKKRKDGTI